MGRKLPTANTSQQIPGRWKAKQIQNLSQIQQEIQEIAGNRRKSRFGMDSLQNTAKVPESHDFDEILEITRNQWFGASRNLKKWSNLCTIIPVGSLFFREKSLSHGADPGNPKFPSESILSGQK